jgi:hypothetical protein
MISKEWRCIWEWRGWRILRVQRTGTVHSVAEAVAVKRVTKVAVVQVRDIPLHWKGAFMQSPAMTVAARKVRRMMVARNFIVMFCERFVRIGCGRKEWL